MIQPTLRPKALLLAGSLATAGAPCAYAVEADAVGERLRALLERQQIAFSYESASVAGNDITLEGVRAGSTIGGEMVPLGDLTLEDVTEEDDDEFRVGAIALDEFEHQVGDLTLSITELTMTGLVLPQDLETDPYGGAMRYDRFEVARVDVDGEDGPLGSLENAYTELSEEDGVLHASGAAEAFSLDLQAIAGSEDTSALLERLGYGQIDGSAFMEGSWQPSDGRLRLTRHEVIVEDAGTFDVTIDIAGYTPELIATLEEMARQSTEGGQNSSARGMAMLGLMQQLTLYGMGIRFTDDSLTGKVIDYVAEREGSTPANIIAQAKAVIPLQLGPFLGEQAAAEVSKAVGDFLENPENLEISATPENPVPFAMIMGVAMGAPEMLVRQLGLSVKANQ